MCTRHVTSNAQGTARLTNDAHHEMPPIEEWKAWDGTAAPGYQFTHDLCAARTQLILSGRSPKVVLRSAVTADPVALRYMCLKACDGTTGVCVIRELPPDRDAIEQFLERLTISVTWNGENIPGLMQKVLLKLLKSDREQPSAAARAQILEAQNNACNLCGATFAGDLEWDHITPLHSTCKGTDQVFQLSLIHI